MSEIIIIVAHDKNRVIGAGNAIPWRLPEDMRQFRERTTGKVVIMGRRTWESLGQKPLKNRINIVVSRTLGEVEGAVVCASLDEAVRLGKEQERDVYIIGGGQLYAEAMGIADKLVVSELDYVVEDEPDAWFPVIPEATWRPVSITKPMEAAIPFSVVEFHRRDIDLP